ncbi:MAG: HNH endonuclease [Pseudomonadota bacterium]
MSRPFEPYHLIWLRSHPHRSEEWLKARLADGFDIHHVDGDHKNNDTDNLVLIEHVDHMRLHGMTGSLGRLTPKKGPRPETMHVGEAAYNAAKKIVDEDGLTQVNGWGLVAKQIGHNEIKAKNAAKIWAESNGLMWPLFLRNGKRQVKTPAQKRRLESEQQERERKERQKAWLSAYAESVAEARCSNDC